MAGMKLDLSSAVGELTQDQRSEVMGRLEAVMEALPPDPESATDAHIRAGLESLIAGYRIGRETDEL